MNMNMNILWDHFYHSLDRVTISDGYSPLSRGPVLLKKGEPSLQAEGINAHTHGWGSSGQEWKFGKVLQFIRLSAFHVMIPAKTWYMMCGCILVRSQTWHLYQSNVSASDCLWEGGPSGCLARPNYQNKTIFTFAKSTAGLSAKKAVILSLIVFEYTCKFYWIKQILVFDQIKQ